MSIPTPRRAPLHAEARAQARFANAQHRLLADLLKRVGQSHGGRRLALPGRRRRDRRDEDQLAIRPVLESGDIVERDLGLVMPIGLEMLSFDPELVAADLYDRPQRGSL